MPQLQFKQCTIPRGWLGWQLWSIANIAWVVESVNAVVAWLIFSMLYPTSKIGRWCIFYFGLSNFTILVLLMLINRFWVRFPPTGWGGYTDSLEMKACKYVTSWEWPGDPAWVGPWVWLTWGAPFHNSLVDTTLSFPECFLFSKKEKRKKKKNTNHVTQHV